MANNPPKPKKKRKRVVAVKTDIGMIGFQQIGNIDQLIKAYEQVTNDVNIPTHLLVEVIDRELSSKDLIDFLRNMSIPVYERVSLKEINNLLKSIPQKLYFFLWSLQNCDVIPIQGILTSHELRKAIYALVRFLGVLECFTLKSQQSIILFENLGYVYFDLAGLARYTRRGFLINGEFSNQTCLLRKVVFYFQQAIQLDAQNSREVDAAHEQVLGLGNRDFGLNEERLNCYLNPWHFLYISSALRFLNDQKVADAYLVKARSILNTLSEHQNFRLREQSELLESVYTTIYYGSYLKFDFGQRNLDKLQKKLHKIKQSKQNRRGSYSPFVEDALSQQFDVQRKLIFEGKLQAEQKAYLNGIYSLYNQSLSPLERDKLIYRLNIPPVKLHGLGEAAMGGQRISIMSDVHKLQRWIH